MVQHNYGSIKNVRLGDVSRPDFPDGSSSEENPEYASTIKKDSRPARLPIIAALQEEAEVIDQLHNLLDRLEESMEPLLRQSFPSAETVPQDSAEPHSDAVGLSEHNARRIFRAGSRVDELIDRLRG